MTSNAKSQEAGSIPGNVITHRYAWRKALEIALAGAVTLPPDIDDRAYWQHELVAFDRTFDRLTELVIAPDAAPPEPASGGKVVAYLHTVVQEGCEPDEALSFSPDSFPLDVELGFKSLSSVPLCKCPPTEPVAGVGDRLERLARKWERVADEQGVVTFTGAEHRLFANELRAIIGTAPADGEGS